MCIFFPFHSDAVPVSTILTSELPTLKAKIEEESLKTPEKSKKDYETEVANLKLYIKRIEDKHAEEINKKDILIGHAQKHNSSLRGENDRLKRLIRKRNKQLEKISVAKVAKKKQDEISSTQVYSKKKTKRILTPIQESDLSALSHSKIISISETKPDQIQGQISKKADTIIKNDNLIKKPNIIRMKDIESEDMSDSYMDTDSEIDIKQELEKELEDTDVFLPDSVKIESTDENVYNDCDDDPLAS